MMPPSVVRLPFPAPVASLSRVFVGEIDKSGAICVMFALNEGQFARGGSLAFANNGEQLDLDVEL